MNSRSGTIVVGVDDSAGSRQALEYAGEQAILEHRALTLVHATPAPSPPWIDAESRAAGDLRRRQEGQAVLGRARRHVERLAPDTAVLEVLSLGDPREVLLELSQDAALVVVGSRGRGHLRSLLLGSTAVAVVRHAQCPVVVHRPQASSTTRHGIAVGADATQDSLDVLDFAYRQADWHGLPLTVVHCWYFNLTPEDDGPRSVNPSQEQRLALAETMAGLAEKYPDVVVHPVVEQGMPERRLLELAEVMNLLVVGQHHGSRAAQFMFGSVSVWLLEHATSPVAVVPLSGQ